MSTRSYICMETEKTKQTHQYLGIYCHWDGYPSYNGAVLLEHYKKREKVENLMKLGNLSALAPNIEPTGINPHSFNHPEPGVCVAYGRDRGETGQGAKLYHIADLILDSWAEYIYIYTLNDEWEVIDVYGDKDMNNEPQPRYSYGMLERAITPQLLTKEMCGLKEE